MLNTLQRKIQFEFLKSFYTVLFEKIENELVTHPQL